MHIAELWCSLNRHDSECEINTIDNQKLQLLSQSSNSAALSGKGFRRLNPCSARCEQPEVHSDKQNVNPLNPLTCSYRNALPSPYAALYQQLDCSLLCHRL